MGSVLIGEAASNENKQVLGGAGGDQTGQEVRICDYRPDFTVVYRCKDTKIRNSIAEAMTQACQNDYIGYTQSVGGVECDRYSMYRLMIITGDIRKINQPCNTDCSQLVSNCVNISGIKVSPYMSTSSEDKILMETGMFEKITNFKESDLVKGDILWRTGHTAVVVQVKTSSLSQEPKWVGEVYNCTTTDVYGDVIMRTKCAYPLLGKGNLVDVCDEFSDMYYVRIAAKYYGFVLKKYIRKKETIDYRIGRIKNSTLRLRKTAPDGIVLKYMPVGSTITITDQKTVNGTVWYKATYQGTIGWCSSKYVTLV